MMDIQKAFEHIESIEFQVNLMVASSWSTLRYGMTLDATFNELYEACKEEATARQVYDRLQELLKIETDLQYANPHDASIATYIVLLENQTHLLNHLSGGNVFWAGRAMREVTKPKAPKEGVTLEKLQEAVRALLAVEEFIVSPREEWDGGNWTYKCSVCGEPVNNHAPDCALERVRRLVGE